MLAFDDIKKAVSIEQVCDWLDIETKKEGNQRRGYCPFCADPSDPRHLVLTPAKGLFFDFCPHHRGGGDCIQLTAQVRGVSIKEAAAMLNQHFRCTTPENKPVPTPDDILKPLEYLEHEHELLTTYGISKEAAEKIGAGFARKGTMRGRLLFPVRTEEGKLVGYLGFNPELSPALLIPKSWRW